MMVSERKALKTKGQQGHGPHWVVWMYWRLYCFGAGVGPMTSQSRQTLPLGHTIALISTFEQLKE